MEGEDVKKADAATGKKVDLTPEEKKAQREAVKKEKAAKKAAAAAKKVSMGEETKEEAPKQEKKKDKAEKKQVADGKAPEPAQQKQGDQKVAKSASSEQKKSDKMAGSGLKKVQTEPVHQNRNNQGNSQNAPHASLSTIYDQSSIDSRKQSILGNVQLVNLAHQNLAKVDRMNPSKIANSYYAKDEQAQQADSLIDNIDLHPAIKECGLKLISGDQLQSTNQVSVAILLAMYEFIKDFKPQKKGVIFHQELLGLLRDQVVPYFRQCRRQLLSGTLNVLDHLRQQITHFSRDCDLEELRGRSLDTIDTYIDNRILYAQDLLIRNGLSIISEKREETLLVYGNEESQTVEAMLMAAHKAGTKRFQVVVVDSAPEYKGRGLAKRLSAAGIKVKYTLIQMLATIITSVTKVFLATSYILCNGASVSPTGTAMVACIANKHNIPVVAVCEAYKFTDRVNLDQLNNNIIGSRHAFESNYLCQESGNSHVLPEMIANQENKNKKSKKDKSVDFFFSLKFDLTPQKFLSMIVCEIGNIPPHSVPVVIREFMQDNEDAVQQNQEGTEDSDSDEEGSAEDLFDPATGIEEKDEEDSDEDQVSAKQMTEKMRRIADRKKQLEGMD